MLLQDIRYAIRRLLKSPAFTLVAVLSLGLGIGANSALFTMVNALFLQDAGIREPERVVQIHWNGQNPYWSISWEWYRGMRDDLSDVFSHTTAYRLNPARTEVTGDRLVSAIYASGDYFGTMGVTPMLGRGFDPGVETDVTDGPPVVVLSYDFWVQAFGADPDVLGSTLRVEATPHTVVGILPDGFSGKASGLEVEVFLPDADAVRRSGSDFLTGGARLHDGISMQQAQDALDRLAQSINANRPESQSRIAFAMYPQSEINLDPAVDRAAAPVIGILFGVVLLVLIIACTNLASFLLARASDRKKEFAVRQAMGAGRGRVITQLLVESLLLAAIGGVVGVGLAQLSVKTLLAIDLPVEVSLNLDTGVDLRILFFTLAVTGLAGVLFGIFPALTAGREKVASTLRDESAGASGGRGKVGLRGALVIAQVSLSLTLLIAAGLFIRSLLAATSVDPGFDRDGIAVVTVDPGNSGYDSAESEQILGEILRQARELPNAESVTMGSRVPLQLGIWRAGIRRPDVEAVPGREYTYPQMAYVSDQYFETLGIDLLLGRGIEATDVRDGPKVVVINQALANQLWPDEIDVVGRTVTLASAPQEPATVVGVTANAKVSSLREEPTPYMYVPQTQNELGQALIIARAARGSDLVLAEELRALAKAVDPDMYVHSATNVADLTSLVLFIPRMGAVLLALFGGLALAMASVGLYGLVNFGVKRRTKEIGIRLSLGADPARVVGMIMQAGTRLVVIGTVIGVGLGLASGFVLEGYLFGISRWDPITILLVPALLVGIGLLASWMPARKAAGIDPATSLRSD